VASTLWNPYPAPMLDPNGNIAAKAKAYFSKGVTTTPLTVYQDPARTVAHPDPAEANSNGIFPPIYLPYESYRIRVTTARDILIFDAKDIANPAPYSESGGVAVKESQLFKTGFTIWLMQADPMDGWIRLNGRTIGSPSSGATERANNDCYDLYKYAWNHWFDTIAPVTGGRGASADADWLANKALQPRPMNGCYAIGNDDGGSGTPTNAIRVATTCIATNGSPVISVTSAFGMVEGMAFYINEIIAGFIVSISGLLVTLTGNFTGTTGGYNCWCSYWGIPNGVGGKAGELSTIMSENQMPYHDHPVTPAGSLALIPGAAIEVAGGTGTLGDPLVVGFAGGSQAQMNIPPSVTGVWYCKL
jgi:hypothetical protein